MSVVRTSVGGGDVGGWREHWHDEDGGGGVMRMSAGDKDVGRWRGQGWWWVVRMLAGGGACGRHVRGWVHEHPRAQGRCTNAGAGSASTGAGGRWWSRDEDVIGWECWQVVRTLAGGGDAGSGKRRGRIVAGDEDGEVGGDEGDEGGGSGCKGAECEEAAAACSDHSGSDGGSDKWWQRRVAEGREKRGMVVTSLNEEKSLTLMPVAKPGQVASGFANSVGLDN
ncbi:hypothetical protein OF83DRAFT_1088029 [Amylostereum chailletii]|nr:hypothetical protein OF83DRAFT_1088029 [Amylostereum chailletii]